MIIGNEKLVEFINKINNCCDISDLFRAIEFIFKEIGSDYIVYNPLSIKDVTKFKEEGPLFTTYPQEWARYYLSKNYFLSDPIVKNLIINKTTFSLKDIVPTHLIEKEQKILHEFQEACTENLVSIYMSNFIGSNYGITLGSKDKSLYYTQDDITLIQIICNHIHAKFTILGMLGNKKYDAQSGQNLTKREIEVLNLSAIGKSSEEIGLMLHISTNTVEFHMKNIFIKLNVYSKIHAVTKAIYYGIIKPNF